MRFAAVGDSFTAGHHAYPDVPRWADLVARSLGVAPGDYLNEAVEGLESGEVMAQVEPAVAFGPDLVTLSCGANDVLLRPRPDLEAYAGNLAWMLDRIRTGAPAARVVLITQPDVSPFVGYRPRSRERVSRGLAAVAETARARARRFGVEVVDVAAMSWDRSDFASDGIHPSERGSRRVAAVVERALAASPPARGARAPLTPA